jgi:hypothetical protein
MSVPVTGLTSLPIVVSVIGVDPGIDAQPVGQSFAQHRTAALAVVRAEGEVAGRRERADRRHRLALSARQDPHHERAVVVLVPCADDRLRHHEGRGATTPGSAAPS